MPENDHPTPSGNEIKLIIDNSLLELEKRFSKTISDALSEQNRTYLKEIVNITKDVATLNAKVDQHEEKLKGVKGMVATVASVSTVLGGFIGFLISQITGGK